MPLRGREGSIPPPMSLEAFMIVKIPHVESVSIAWTKSMPPGLLVHATGTVPTLGWSGAQLVPWVYIREPEDGIWDFDFVAQPPDAIAGQKISPIVAQAHVFPAPRWCRGVRVHGSAGSVSTDEPSEEAKGMLATASWVPYPWSRSDVSALAQANGGATASDPGDAFPWAVVPAPAVEGKGGDSILKEPVSVLIGPAVRIFHEGDAITMDYRPERVNIERARYGNTIRRIFRG